jgi:condensin complex subunit 1
MKKVSETNSQILPPTVVSRHSQELPAILDDSALSVSDRSAHLNALKMNCYALIRLLESFETVTSHTSLMNLDVGGKVIRSSWLTYMG